MRHLLVGALCTLLAQPAFACGLQLPELLTRQDSRIKEKLYAGKHVRSYTLTLKDESGRGEYVSYLQGLNLGAYIIADDCGDERCLDIYADRDADGKLDDHYRVPYGKNVLAQVPLRYKLFVMQGDMKRAFEDGAGRVGALRVLEEVLRAYRLPLDDASSHQSTYATTLDGLRSIFCSASRDVAMDASASLVGE